MKKILAILSTLGLLIPGIALAAFDDVSLTTSAVIVANGVTVNVSGSTATIESITVDTGSFTVYLQNNSSITLSAVGLHALSVVSSAPIALTTVCDSSASSVAATSSIAATLTISPSGDTCPLTSTSGSGGGGGGSNGPITGGGGGGGSVPVTVIAPPTMPTPSAPDQSAAVASLLAQLKSLVATIKSLGGTVSPALEAILNASPNASFNRDMQVGSTGADVQALQVYLNTHSYIVAASGPGSSGNETSRFGAGTRAALVKLQKAAGISPAAGYLGAKTRAYIAAHP